MNALIAIMITLIGCTEDTPIKKIELRKVDFAITSIITVDCDKLESYFKEELETIIIEDNDKIEKIFKIISNLESDTSNYKPDVRAKLLIYYDNNKVDTICMNDIGIILNGQSYNVNKKLVDFVEKAHNELSVVPIYQFKNPNDKSLCNRQRLKDELTQNKKQPKS